MDPSRQEPVVVITGCGWVTPFAAGSISHVLSAGRDIFPDAGGVGAVGRIERTPVPADLLEGTPEVSKEIRADKGAWLSATALIQACRDASLDLKSIDSGHVGLALGCGLAGQDAMMNFATEVREQSPRFASPLHFPQTVGNYPAGALARGFNLTGPNLTLSCGVASGLRAVVEAVAQVRDGRADVMLAGGMECVSDPLQAAFANDAGLTDGACLLVLESQWHAEARGARPLATILSSPATYDEKRCGEADIVSTAGHTRPGAVLIESLVGECTGALGAAALAAGIGGASGCVVPVVSVEDSRSVSFKAVSSSPMDAVAPRCVVCLAGGEGDDVVALELCVP